MEPKLAAVQKRVRSMYGPNIQTLLVGSKVDGRGRQGWTYYRSVLLGKTPRTIQLAAVKASSGGKLKIVSTSGSFLGTHRSLPGIPAGSKLSDLGWDLK
jgi:hypothetical protein